MEDRMNVDGPLTESQQLIQSVAVQPLPTNTPSTDNMNNMDNNENRGIKRSFHEMTQNAVLPVLQEGSDLPPAVHGAPMNVDTNNTNTDITMQSMGEQSVSTNPNGPKTVNTVNVTNNMTATNPTNGGCIIINKKGVTPPEEKDWSHITEADLELDEFKCPRCSKAFKTTNDLFVHMRETYDDPTVCQVCGKNLNCMANVLSHSYLHQDVKPYKCPKCKYQTRTRFNLRVHFGSCAKLEKFSYKRGQGPKRRRTINTKNRKRAKRASRRRLDLDDSGILSHMYDDILNQLADSGPYNAGERDVSCLVQVHIQHFPRTNADGTDRFYQQSEGPKRHQVQAPPITDVAQFYAGAQAPKPQW